MLAVGSLRVAMTCQVYFIATATGTTTGMQTWYHSTVTAMMGCMRNKVSVTKTRANWAEEPDDRTLRGSRPVWSGGEVGDLPADHSLAAERRRKRSQFVL